MGLPVRDQDYAIEQEMEKFRKDGSMVRGKTGMAYEHFVIPRLVAIVQDPDTPASTVLAAANHLAEIADLKPKQHAPATPGTGFSINIVFPQTPTPSHPDTAGTAPPIEGALVNVTPIATPEPEGSQGFRVPDFRLGSPAPRSGGSPAVVPNQAVGGAPSPLTVKEMVPA